MSGDLIQLRRGTASEWSTANPVLDEGEPGLELGVTDKVKYGDGTTPWNDLDYATGGGGGGGGGIDTIVAGTGIDVDSTDPANPVVSATGGGGGGGTTSDSDLFLLMGA